MTSYLDSTVGEFLDAVAAREPAPGGGCVAAVVTAMAAGLVAMAARYSEGRLGDAADVAGRADELRAAAGPLADADADAYGAVLAAYALPRESGSGPGARIRESLERAAEVPLRIAGVAAEVAELGARLAREGNPNLVGDARTAVLLAEAAARSAAELVRIDVELGDLDERFTVEARQRAEDAAEAVRRANTL
ncbi:MAG: cyclodeaminase/cyclohydrolase family protein [Streptosporangiaceae bacterium]